MTHGRSTLRTPSSEAVSWGAGGGQDSHEHGWQPGQQPGGQGSLCAPWSWPNKDQGVPFFSQGFTSSSLPSPFLSLVSTPSPPTHTPQRDSCNPLPHLSPTLPRASPAAPTFPAPAIWGWGAERRRGEGKVTKYMLSNKRTPNTPHYAPQAGNTQPAASVWNNKTGVDVAFSQGIWLSPGNAKACIVNAPDCVKPFVAALAPPGTPGPRLGKGPRHRLEWFLVHH